MAGVKLASPTHAKSCWMVKYDKYFPLKDNGDSHRRQNPYEVVRLQSPSPVAYSIVTATSRRSIHVKEYANAVIFRINLLVDVSDRSGDTCFQLYSTSVCMQGRVKRAFHGDNVRLWELDRREIKNRDRPRPVKDCCVIWRDHNCILLHD